MAKELTKRCTRCDTVRDITRFQRDSRRRPDGTKDSRVIYRSVCKDCDNLSRRRNRDARRLSIRINAQNAQQSPDTRMTEKERQRRLRAVEAMW